MVRSVKDNKIVINNYQVICKDKTNINIGSTIKVNGRVKKPSSNTNFNLFNYKNYLLSKKIDYLFILWYEISSTLHRCHCFIF